MFDLFSRKIKSNNFIREYNLPHLVMLNFAKKYPLLSDEDLNLVILGLKQYFAVALQTKKQYVAMPSRGVDELWHEFILCTRAYHAFCQKVFGRYFHHEPTESKSSHREELGLINTWKFACKLEKINPKTPKRLPLLFTLDQQLDIAEGFYYQLNELPQKLSNMKKNSKDIYLNCGGNSSLDNNKSLWDSICDFTDGGDGGCDSGCGGD